MSIYKGLLSKKHILLIVSAPGGRSQENGSHEFISRASSEEHHPVGEDPTLEAWSPPGCSSLHRTKLDLRLGHELKVRRIYSNRAHNFKISIYYELLGDLVSFLSNIRQSIPVSYWEPCHFCLEWEFWGECTSAHSKRESGSLIRWMKGRIHLAIFGNTCFAVAQCFLRKHGM